MCKKPRVLQLVRRLLTEHGPSTERQLRERDNDLDQLLAPSKGRLMSQLERDGQLVARAPPGRYNMAKTFYLPEQG